MRINREQSQLSFRRRTNRSGCLSFWVVLVVLVGIALVTRPWWQNWVNINEDARALPTMADAQRSFRQGDLNSTIEMTSALYTAKPNDYGALAWLVRALIYRSYTDFRYEPDRAKALSLTSEAVVKSNSQRDVLAIHAFVLQINGRTEDATRLALRVIDRDDNNIMARLALALAYSNGGLFEAGLREANKAVSIAEMFAPEWQWDAGRVRAIAYSSLGKWGDALTEINRAIPYNPRLAPAHYERALYALQIGDADIATSAYFSVLAFDSENVKARFRLCELSSSMREYDSAVRYCTEVTQRAPEWAEGWYQLGREYFLQGNFALAEQALNRCSTLQVLQNVPIPERRFECWYIQGQAAEILGDCPNLLATYYEFQLMAITANLPQTWTYPPEGPSICLTPTPTT
jgi:tetratricopeptide (TPR) repeat protein